MYTKSQSNVCHLRRVSKDLSRFYQWVLLFALVVCGCFGSDPSSDSAENRTGVTNDRIRIGSSLALDGHAGYLGSQMRHGAMACIRQVNDQGGIHGRKIELVALDDGYDPAHCLYNTQQLIVDKKVFLLFCYVGTPTTVKVIPLVNEARIPLLGMLTGATRLRRPFNPWLINVRASYYQETQAAVDLIVGKKGVKQVAVFYQYDEYGFDGLRGTEIALKDYGLVPVGKGTYIRGTQDVAAGLDKIIASNAQAVVMIGTYDACARFIRLARERNFSPLFYNVSFVGSREFARRLGPDGEGVMITQVVPPPEDPAQREGLPGVKEYIRLLRLYYPESQPSFVGLEGYVNATILVEGLKRAGRDLTREGFIRAVESIDAFDPGIGSPLSFGKNDHQGLDRVYFTQIRQGRPVLIQ